MVEKPWYVKKSFGTSKKPWYVEKNQSPLLCEFPFVPARCDTLCSSVTLRGSGSSQSDAISNKSGDQHTSTRCLLLLIKSRCYGGCEARGGAASPEPCPGTVAAAAQQRGSAAGGSCEPQGGEISPGSCPELAAAGQRRPSSTDRRRRRRE
jgi:hypothetical protein